MRWILKRKTPHRGYPGRCSDLLSDVLQEHHILFTRLPSVGSFLHERNATYLVS